MTVPVAFLQIAATVSGHNVDGLGCPPSSKSEIVVCGSPAARSPYRLPVLSGRYEQRRLRAETDVAGLHARVQAETPIRQDGLQDKRVMLTLSTHF